MDNPTTHFARPSLPAILVAALAWLASVVGAPFASAEVHLSKDQEAHLIKECMAQKPKNGPDYCDCMSGAVQNGLSPAEYRTWVEATAQNKPISAALQTKLAGFAETCDAVTTPAR